MPTRRAHAVWTGDIREGKGTFEGESASIGGSYSFGSRFAEDRGTNPEELLAAAEAACFSMALSGALGRAGTPPERIETHAACTVEKVGEGFTITSIRLQVKARVPGADLDTLRRTAEETKQGCPVSRALSGVEISVEVELE